MSSYNYKWLHRITRFGTTEAMEDEMNRKIIFSNVIFISLPVVYLIFMAIDYNSFLQPISDLRFDQFIVPIVILICFFCLWLNKIGQVLVSRMIFIILWPFLLHVIPIYLLRTPLDYYLAYPFGLVFHSILIQLMFSYQKEKFIFWGFIGLNFLALMIAPNTLIYFVPEGSQPNELALNKYYLLDGILYWLLFNLVMFYVLYIVDHYIIQLNTSKTLIENQKEELNTLNQNLETIVQQRTHELEIQNNKLRSYSYYNAHLLRAPFCRIKGLVYLKEFKNDGPEDYNHEIDQRLKESVVELEHIIFKIKEIVHSEFEDKV